MTAALAVLAALAVGEPAYTRFFRNQGDSALRIPVAAESPVAGTLRGSVGGVDCEPRKLSLPAGAGFVDLRFDSAQFAPGEYEWKAELGGLGGQPHFAKSGRLKGMLLTCKQIIVPILHFGRLRDDRQPLRFQLRGHAPIAFLSGLVVIHAEQNSVCLRHLLQRFQHRLDRGSAAGNVAVFLPVSRIQRNMGQKINGSLENKQAPVCSDMVKAVSRIAALDVDVAQA